MNDEKNIKMEAGVDNEAAQSAMAGVRDAERSGRRGGVATAVIIVIIVALTGVFAFQLGVKFGGKPAAQAVPGGAGSGGGQAVQAVPGRAAPSGGQSGSPGSGGQTAPAGGQAARNTQGGAQGGQTAAGGAGSGAGQRLAAQGGQAAQVSGRGGAPGSAPGRNASAVRVRQVELGAVENSVVLGGEVFAAAEVPVYPVAAGKISELRVRVGDRVQKGQTVAMIDPSKPGDMFFPSPVTAAVSGTALSVPVSVGDTVQTGTAVCVIGDIGALRLETFVPERFSVNMKAGLSAQVRFQAVPGETFRAEIDELSPVLDPASRTRRIRLRFTDERGVSSRDPRVLAGMYATLTLVTDSRSGVPVIPRQSLINTYGTWIVYIIDENGNAKRREVDLGLESESMVEIVSGLAAGERVVVEGQTFLSDGDPVRILE